MTATEMDAEWFATRPHRQYRVRPLVAGELPVPPPVGDGLRPFVVVAQIAPGVRVRGAFLAAGEPGQSEAAGRHFAAQIFGGAVCAAPGGAA